MLIICVVTFILSLPLLEAQEYNPYYCIVEGKSPGIIISDLSLGKDNELIAYHSEYTDETTKKLEFFVKDKWEIRSFLNQTETKISEPIFDQRWETLPNSHINIIDYMIIEDFKKRNTSFLNFRLYNSSSLSEKMGWNLVMKNYSGQYYCGNSYKNCSQTQEKFDLGFLDSHDNVLYKMQNYTYFYTERNKINEEIYSKTENCTKITEGCFTIFVSIGKMDKVTLLFNPNQPSYGQKVDVVTGSGNWITHQINITNFTDCFTILAQTKSENNSENLFWAIGSSGYISKTQNCYDNKRYIRFETKNISNYLCETATNEKINFTQQLPMLKIQETTLAPNNTNSTSTSTVSTSTVNTSTSTVTNILHSYYTILVIPVLVIIAVPVCYIYRKKYVSKTTNEMKEVLTLNSLRRNESENETLLSSREFIISSNWSPIQAAEFKIYTKNVSKPDSDVLQNQFSSLPSGFSNKKIEGTKTENVSKNVIPTICPFDKNRVKLKKRHQFFKKSDYINASYIQGFSSYREYIATQNPLVNTVSDFWFMIWQQNVKHIVMISSEIDSYYCYWPSESNNSVVYNNIKITLRDVRQHNFYKQRFFEIKYRNISRQLEQIHYDSWDDEDPPLVKTSKILDFFEYLLKVPHLSSPIVVHCLAGIGRTGLVILCDTVLRSLPSTDTIDIYSVTKTLRLSRLQMIHKLELYQLAHLIIANYLEKTKKEQYLKSVIYD